jgi:hypothetical protein
VAGLTVKKIMIVTPSYDGKVSVPYLEAIQSYRNKIDFDITFAVGSSLLAKTRNDLLSVFYKSEMFTHMLMLDADIMLSYDSLQKMIDLDLDVVGAPIPIGKKITPWGMVQKVIGVREQVGHMLYTVDAIGTAALMVSRTAVESLIFDAKASGKVYTDLDQEKHEVFFAGSHSGKYWGEDFNLCLSLRGLGFDIYALSDTAVAHANVPKDYAYRAPMQVGETTLDKTWNKLKVTDVAFRWTTQEALTRFGE